MRKLSALLAILLTAAPAWAGFKYSGTSFTSTGVTFANLSDPAKVPQVDGTIIWVSDGSQTATCTGGGMGALGVRLNGVWTCAAGTGGAGTSVTAGNGLSLSSSVMSLLAPSNNTAQTGTTETINLSTTNEISELLSAAGPQTTAYTFTGGYDGEKVVTTLCNNGTGTNDRTFSYGGTINYLYDGGTLPSLPQQGGACEVIQWELHLTQPSNTLIELRRTPVVPSVTLNNDAAGTTQFELVKTNSSNTIQTIATTDIDGVIGVCIAGCGTSGLGLVQVMGVARIAMDGSVISGDWVIPSTTSAGKGHDAGATRPGVAQPIGIVVSPTTGGAGTYNVLLELGPPARGMISSASAGTLGTTTGTTTYLAIPGTVTSTTETAVGMPWASNTRLSNMACHVAVAPGASNSYAFTLDDNLSGGGVASTGITCTISGTAANCHDVTHTYTVAASDGAGAGSITDVKAVLTVGGSAPTASTATCVFNTRVQ